MNLRFVAGFGPIVRDGEESRRFWRDVGFPLAELAPEYHGTDEVDGVKAFALWPLSQAAESTFGSSEWPADIPVPQAWLEVDVDLPAAVAEATEELRSKGHRVLRESREEPWGQTTSRLLSPEGLLVGVAYTPWMHDVASVEPADANE